MEISKERHQEIFTPNLHEGFKDDGDDDDDEEGRFIISLDDIEVRDDSLDEYEKSQIGKENCSKADLGTNTCFLSSRQDTGTSSNVNSAGIEREDILRSKQLEADSTGRNVQQNVASYINRDGDGINCEALSQFNHGSKQSKDVPLFSSNTSTSWKEESTISPLFQVGKSGETEIECGKNGQHVSKRGDNLVFGDTVKGDPPENRKRENTVSHVNNSKQFSPKESCSCIMCYQGRGIMDSNWIPKAAKRKVVSPDHCSSKMMKLTSNDMPKGVEIPYTVQIDNGQNNPFIMKSTSMSQPFSSDVSRSHLSSQNNVLSNSPVTSSNYFLFVPKSSSCSNMTPPLTLLESTPLISPQNSQMSSSVSLPILIRKPQVLPSIANTISSSSTSLNSHVNCTASSFSPTMTSTPRTEFCTSTTAPDSDKTHIMYVDKATADEQLTGIKNVLKRATKVDLSQPGVVLLHFKSGLPKAPLLKSPNDMFTSPTQTSLPGLHNSGSPQPTYMESAIMGIMKRHLVSSPSLATSQALPCSNIVVANHSSSFSTIPSKQNVSVGAKLPYSLVSKTFVPNQLNSPRHSGSLPPPPPLMPCPGSSDMRSQRISKSETVEVINLEDEKTETIVLPLPKKTQEKNTASEVPVDISKSNKMLSSPTLFTFSSPAAISPQKSCQNQIYSHNTLPSLSSQPSQLVEMSKSSSVVSLLSPVTTSSSLFDMSQQSSLHSYVLAPKPNSLQSVPISSSFQQSIYHVQQHHSSKVVKSKNSKSPGWVSLDPEQIASSTTATSSQSSISIVNNSTGLRMKIRIKDGKSETIKNSSFEEHQSTVELNKSPQPDGSTDMDMSISETSSDKSAIQELPVSNVSSVTITADSSPEKVSSCIDDDDSLTRMPNSSGRIETAEEMFKRFEEQATQQVYNAQFGVGDIQRSLRPNRAPNATSDYLFPHNIKIRREPKNVKTDKQKETANKDEADESKYPKTIAKSVLKSRRKRSFSGEARQTVSDQKSMKLDINQFPKLMQDNSILKKKTIYTPNILAGHKVFVKFNVFSNSQSGKTFLVPFFNIGGSRVQFDVEDMEYINKAVVEFEKEEKTCARHLMYYSREGKKATFLRKESFHHSNDLSPKNYKKHCFILQGYNREKPKQIEKPLEEWKLDKKVQIEIDRAEQDSELDLPFEYDLELKKSCDDRKNIDIKDPHSTSFSRLQQLLLKHMKPNSYINPHLASMSNDDSCNEVQSHLQSQRSSEYRPTTDETNTCQLSMERENKNKNVNENCHSASISCIKQLLSKEAEPNNSDVNPTILDDDVHNIIETCSHSQMKSENATNKKIAHQLSLEQEHSSHRKKVNILRKRARFKEKSLNSQLDGSTPLLSDSTAQMNQFDRSGCQNASRSTSNCSVKPQTSYACDTSSPSSQSIVHTTPYIKSEVHDYEFDVALGLKDSNDLHSSNVSIKSEPFDDYTESLARSMNIPLHIEEVCSNSLTSNCQQDHEEGTCNVDDKLLAEGPAPITKENNEFSENQMSADIEYNKLSKSSEHLPVSDVADKPLFPKEVSSSCTNKSHENNLSCDSEGRETSPDPDSSSLSDSSEIYSSSEIESTSEEEEFDTRKNTLSSVSAPSFTESATNFPLIGNENTSSSNCKITSLVESLKQRLHQKDSTFPLLFSDSRLHPKKSKKKRRKISKDSKSGNTESLLKPAASDKSSIHDIVSKDMSSNASCLKNAVDGDLRESVSGINSALSLTPLSKSSTLLESSVSCANYHNKSSAVEVKDTSLSSTFSPNIEPNNDNDLITVNDVSSSTKQKKFDTLFPLKSSIHPTVKPLRLSGEKISASNNRFEVKSRDAFDEQECTIIDEFDYNDPCIIENKIKNRSTESTYTAISENERNSDIATVKEVVKFSDSKQENMGGKSTKPEKVPNQESCSGRSTPCSEIDVGSDEFPVEDSVKNSSPFESLVMSPPVPTKGGACTKVFAREKDYMNTFDSIKEGTFVNSIKKDKKNDNIHQKLNGDSSVEKIIPQHNPKPSIASLLCQKLAIPVDSVDPKFDRKINHPASLSKAAIPSTQDQPALSPETSSFFRPTLRAIFGVDDVAPPVVKFEDKVDGIQSQGKQRRQVALKGICRMKNKNTKKLPADTSTMKTVVNSHKSAPKEGQKTVLNLKIRTKQDKSKGREASTGTQKIADRKLSARPIPPDSSKKGNQKTMLKNGLQPKNLIKEKAHVGLQPKKNVKTSGSVGLLFKKTEKTLNRVGLQLRNKGKASGHMGLQLKNKEMVSGQGKKTGRVIAAHEKFSIQGCFRTWRQLSHEEKSKVAVKSISSNLYETSIIPCKVVLQRLDETQLNKSRQTTESCEKKKEIPLENAQDKEERPCMKRRRKRAAIKASKRKGPREKKDIVDYYTSMIENLRKKAQMLEEETAKKVPEKSQNGLIKEIKIEPIAFEEDRNEMRSEGEDDILIVQDNMPCENAIKKEAAVEEDAQGEIIMNSSENSVICNDFNSEICQSKDPKTSNIFAKNSDTGTNENTDKEENIFPNQATGAYCAGIIEQKNRKGIALRSDLDCFQTNEKNHSEENVLPNQATGAVSIETNARICRKESDFHINSGQSPNMNANEIKDKEESLISSKQAADLVHDDPKIRNNELESTSRYQISDSVQIRKNDVEGEEGNKREDTTSFNQVSDFCVTRTIEGDNRDKRVQAATNIAHVEKCLSVATEQNINNMPVPSENIEESATLIAEKQTSSAILDKGNEESSLEMPTSEKPGHSFDDNTYLSDSTEGGALVIDYESEEDVRKDVEAERNSVKRVEEFANAAVISTNTTTTDLVSDASFSARDIVLGFENELGADTVLSTLSQGDMEDLFLLEDGDEDNAIGMIPEEEVEKLLGLDVSSGNEKSDSNSQKAGSSKDSLTPFSRGSSDYTKLHWTPLPEQENRTFKDHEGDNSNGKLAISHDQPGGQLAQSDKGESDTISSQGISDSDNHLKVPQKKFPVSPSWNRLLGKEALKKMETSASASAEASSDQRNKSAPATGYHKLKFCAGALSKALKLSAEMKKAFSEGPPCDIKDKKVIGAVTNVEQKLQGSVIKECHELLNRIHSLDNKGKSSELISFSANESNDGGQRGSTNGKGVKQRKSPRRGLGESYKDVAHHTQNVLKDSEPSFSALNNPGPQDQSSTKKGLPSTDANSNSSRDRSILLTSSGKGIDLNKLKMKLNPFLLSCKNIQPEGKKLPTPSSNYSTNGSSEGTCKDTALGIENPLDKRDPKSDKSYQEQTKFSFMDEKKCTQPALKQAIITADKPTECEPRLDTAKLSKILKNLKKPISGTINAKMMESSSTSGQLSCSLSKKVSISKQDSLDISSPKANNVGKNNDRKLRSSPRLSQPQTSSSQKNSISAQSGNVPQDKMKCENKFEEDEKGERSFIDCLSDVISGAWKGTG